MNQTSIIPNHVSENALFDKDTGWRIDIPSCIEPGTRVLCLYRVSTDKQLYQTDNNEADIPMQRKRCRKYCESMGWTIVCELQEEGVSGHKVRAENRDKIQLIKEYAKQKKFDILLVFMFDRIGRISDETPFVVEWFVRNGIRVWSTQEGEQRFDNHTDKLTNYIRFWQADGESEKTSIRTANSMGLLAEDGCFTGGSRPYGYDFVKSGRKNKRRQEVNDLLDRMGLSARNGWYDEENRVFMKANAAVSSEELVEIKEAPGVYWERLDAYEEEGLEKLKEQTGKRRKKRVKQIKKTIRRSHKRVSHTDPDAGHMKRPGKPEGPQYLVHEATDSDNGFIVDVVVTGGDSSDSAPYLDQIERINKNVVPIQAAAADSAYNVPMFYRALKDLGIDFYVPPRKNNDCTKAEFKHKDFAYEKETDSYLCPAGKRLELHGLNRTVSGLNWSYKADRKDCDACPFRQKCLNMHAPARIIGHSYFYDLAWDGKGHVDEPARREALKRRLIWCEGTFSAQKRSHNLRQIFRRGLGAAEDHGLLSAAALNLKKLIKCLG